MPDFFHDPLAALIAIVLLVLSVAFIQLMNAKNPLEWWHFISTKDKSGKQYADLDKLGKMVGIIVGSIVVMWLAYRDKLSSDVFFVYLAFVGAVAGWSAYLRAKQGDTNGHDSAGSKK